LHLLSVEERLVALDVHDPETVRCSGIERPLHQVVGGLGTEISPRAATPATPVDAHNPGLAHQALDPSNARRDRV
jgi:hypothetical protein